MDLNLATLMATEFDEFHVSISIHLQVWTRVSGHSLPLVSTHLIFVQPDFEQLARDSTYKFCRASRR